MRHKALILAVTPMLLATGASGGEPLYGRRAEHRWDAARDAFYVRRFATGEVFEHPHAFAPPWTEHLSFVHDAAFHQRVVERLEALEKLAAVEMEGQPAVRRVMFPADGGGRGRAEAGGGVAGVAVVPAAGGGAVVVGDVRGVPPGDEGEPVDHVRVAGAGGVRAGRSGASGGGGGEEEGGERGVEDVFADAEGRQGIAMRAAARELPEVAIIPS